MRSLLFAVALALPLSAGAARADDTSDFFNGKDLTGWEGLTEYWSAKDGAIVGYTPKDPGHNTFLCSKKKYKDFELSFKIRLKDGVGNSGVQIRSEILDPKKFTAKGPQADIGQNYWGSLYGENFGGMMKACPKDFVKDHVKEKDFNDYYIKCVGKHVTIKINGATSVDADFPKMPDDGIIAWQLHAGFKSMEVTFKDIKFKDLSKGKGDKKDAVKLKTVPSSGRVTLDGQPLAGATVTFHPADGKKTSPRASGLTGDDGTFVLSTYGKADGAPIGEYVVTIALEKKGAGPDDRPKLPRNLIPATYSDPAKSPLRVRVEDKKQMTFDFALAAKGDKKDATKERAAVSGTVTFNGKPLSGARVTFVPSDGKGASATGVTDDSGAYKVKSKDGDGVAPGQYRILITGKAKEGKDSKEIDPGIDPKKTDRPRAVKAVAIPAVYGNPKTTPLVADLKAGSNTVNIELSAK
jgi:hypothetical protein